VVEVRLSPRDTSDQPVDVFLGDAGVLEREPRRPDVELGGAQVRYDADFGIGRPDDRDLIFE
jgi:hypothetical protein